MVELQGFKYNLIIIDTQLSYESLNKSVSLSSESYDLEIH